MKYLPVLFLVLLYGFRAAPAQLFQIEMITSVNSAREILFDQDTLYAATDGGLLVYQPASGAEQRLTVLDGFFTQQFSSLALARNALLVAGSETGVVSFWDRSNGTVYNDLSLDGEEVVDLAVAEDTLWVATRKLIAVYRYKPQQGVYRFLDVYRNFPGIFENLRAVTVFAGRIWVATDQGLLSAPSDFGRFNLRDASQWQVLNGAQGLTGDNVLDLAAGSDWLYLATNNGLYRYNLQALENFQQGLLSKFLLRVKVLGGAVYVGDERRVYRFTGQGFEAVLLQEEFSITDFALHSSGELWVSLQERGLLNVSRGERIQFDGPLTNFVGPLLLDRQGRLWCGSSTQDVQRTLGLYMFDGEHWTNYRFFGPQLWRNLSAVTAVEEDAEGNIWIGSWEGGLAVFDQQMSIHTLNRNDQVGQVWISGVNRDDTLDLVTPPEVLNLFAQTQGARPNSAVVTDIFYDELHQSIWTVNWNASNGRPILRFPQPAFNQDALDASNWLAYSIPLGMVAPGDLRDYARDIFGILWIATGGDGAVRLQLKEDGSLGWDKVTQTEDNLKTNQTLSVAADQDGYVWIGTREGLSAYLSGTVFDFREDFQPIGLKINDIFVDVNNNKWFATDRGLSLLKSTGSPFDHGSWFHMVPRRSELSGDNVFHIDLPTEEIHSVVVDPATSDVFLGTPAGIAILRSNPFASTFQDYERFRLGPNPFLLTGKGQEELTLFNLTPGSTVRILTAAGHLVRELRPGNQEEVMGNQARWDGKNMEGELVHSGVYVVLVVDAEGNRAAAKVLVINQMQP